MPVPVPHPEIITNATLITKKTRILFFIFSSKGVCSFYCKKMGIANQNSQSQSLQNK
jgi:hypothetical protein